MSETAAAQTRQERYRATRAALIDAARTRIGEDGYEEVSLDAIARGAGVTKGALYHHFPDGKKELMDAVFEAVEAEVTASIATEALAAAGSGPVLDVMREAAASFMERSLDPRMQQIVMIDAPAVLGWDRWREVAAEHGLGVIEGLLKEGVARGEIRDVPIGPVAHILLAALSESAMVVSRSSDRRAATRDAVEAVSAILDGLVAK